MKIEVEVSKPHYHPSKDEDTSKFTKKRNLSVPPHWVANERVEHNGKSYAVVMPPREESLWEDRQYPHIHMPPYITVKIDGIFHRIKVKVGEGQATYEPKIHFDDSDAEIQNIKSGTIVEI